VERNVKGFDLSLHKAIETLCRRDIRCGNCSGRVVAVRSS